MNARTAPGTSELRVHHPIRSCYSLVVLALTLVSSNIQAQVGSWKLELGSGQFVLDFSGRNHGVLGKTSAVEPSDPAWTRSGFISGGLQFNRVDLVTVVDSAALRLTKDMTICASFYVDAFNNDWVRVVGKMADPNTRNYGLWYHPNGTALFQIYGVSNGRANAQVRLPIVRGQWYTMVGVKQGTGVRLYVNGTRVASTTLTVAPLTSNAPLTIGLAPLHTGHQGRIDQVVVYDRALTDSEIRAMYSFASFVTDTTNISVANGGTQKFTLNVGPAFRGKRYWIHGSVTGILPGIVLAGIPILLMPDPYTDLLIAVGNSAVLTNFRGTLSAVGVATASLNIPAGLSIPVGYKLFHAYLIYDGTTGKILGSSNPAWLQFK